MEGRPPPLDPLRLPQPPPPFHLSGLLSASAAAHAFPYLSSLTSGGGNGLGALGGSPFRTPHSASTAAAMRQFWPPTPPPDSYGRYGGSYYSLFPSVGPLSSPPDPYSGHQALFSRLSHSASPYSPVLDLHRDPNFLSPGLNLTSPLTPTNLSNHVSPMSPLATSSLLSPPTATSAGMTLSGGPVDSLAPQDGRHHHSDGLLTTVHQSNGPSQKAGCKTAAAPVKERRPEKSRLKKSSHKAKDLTGSKIKENKAEPTHCVKCSWSAHCTELPPWPAPPTSVTTKVTATTAPVVTTTVSPCQNSEGGASRTSLTFCTSLCIPSDQVSSTVPSPSAPSLLSPSGQPIVSSSTSDVEGTSRTPDISTTPVPDSSKPASPVATETAEIPSKKPLSTAEQYMQDEKEKPVDLSDSSAAPRDLSLSPCSSTTAEEKRTMVVSVSPIMAKSTPPPEKSAVIKAVDLWKETPKVEVEVRPTCQYGHGAQTKQEPVDFRSEPVASCVVKPQMASTYMPLSKAAVMLSVQQTKVVSSTRVRGVKAGGVAVGMTKAATTSRALISSPLNQVSPRVQEVAPVNLKVTKPLASEPATPATLGVQRSEGTPRLAVAPEARKIVVEEKCDTTVSVVPALSVLNAANQHIPVGIAVAQQRQDHTITCSKTSMSASSSEQGQITAVSCSTVILTTGNSDKNSCISEQKHGLQPHPGSLAEATTACLVATGPSTSHSPWDQQTDALSLRPPTATLRWLAAPPVANTSPSVVTPTLWLGQNAAPLDTTPSSAFPLTSPGGFQLARDAVTGQLYLVPAASWTLTSPAAPVQQILTQQHTTFQQIVPETWSADMMKAAEVVPKLEVAETKDPTLAFSTLGTAPHQSVMSYVYDAAPVVQPLVTTHTAAIAPVIAPPTKVSQGTSPQTSLTPSPPPQQVVVEQGIQASDTDGAVDESDDDYVRGDPMHVSKVVHRVTSVTTAVQVDMDSQTTSEDNETNDSATCFVRTFDCANQTDDLPLQKEVPSSCDETTCDEEERDLHQQAIPMASGASVSNRSSEIHFTSDSEIDDSIPVLTTQSSGVREFIDHHGLDLLVDSIEEFAASQQSETERMPRLLKSASETGSPLISPSDSPRNDGPPNLSSASPSSRPGEMCVHSPLSSPKLVLVSPEYDSTDLESSPQRCVTSAQQVKENEQQRTNQCSINSEDRFKLCLPQEGIVTGIPAQKSEKLGEMVVSLEAKSSRSPMHQLASVPAKHNTTQDSFAPQQPESLFWSTNHETWQNVKSETSTNKTSEDAMETVADLPPSYDGSCTDGLGLLCALAEQRFLEESRKEQQKPALTQEPQAEPQEDVDVECEEPTEAMDPVEREMRIQLAELQRKFREKQQELANFQPRKDRECDAEEQLHAHKKEQVRHKKRRHSIAAIKAPETTTPEAFHLSGESPKAEERVPSLHSADDAFSALLRTPDQRQKSQTLTNKTVYATCESHDAEKTKEEGRQQCVPVLTIKWSPEQYPDEASKSEVTESESTCDAQPVTKKRKRRTSTKEKTAAAVARSPKKDNVDENIKSPSPHSHTAKKNSRSKEDRRSKSFSEGDFWCVRRSERIFLLDAGVVSSSSLSISDNPEKTATPSRSRSSNKRSGKRELVSVLKKCRQSGDAQQENDDDSDSDSTENVPLSRLSSRERHTDVEEQQCYLEPSDLHDLTRVVMLEDGLFYAGYINEIQAPDVYGITLDGERGNRPHIFSQEEMLKEAVREVKPRSLRELPEGRRVCAYWSQQYRCLYPGAVAKATSPNPSPDSSLVYVEFDDGDSGKIPLEDVRLLPQDYPPIDEQHARGKRVRKPFALKAGKDPPPSLVLNKKRSRTSQDGGEESKDDADEGHSKKMKKRKKSKLKKTKIKNPASSSHDSDDSDVFGGEEKSTGSMVRKRRREHKHRHHHKHHRCHHRRKHRHHRKRQDTEKNDDTESPRHSSDAVKASSASLSCSSEQTSGCSANCSPSATEETRDCKHPELTVRIRTSSTEMQQADSDAGGESSADASEDSSSGSSDEDEVKEDGTSIATTAEQTQEMRKPAKRKERLPSVEKSKIAAFLPERQLWRWSGKSFRRPGTKGKAKKEFYKAICRGKETITVGDCAVFLSTGRPNLPYIGRIETMWQSWGGNMIVRVKWFYHPDETKGLAKLIQPKGALFQSPHADENDVQTISHKCEVLSWNDYRALCKSEAADGTSDVYYLAGSYDPYANTICIEPQVKKP